MESHTGKEHKSKGRSGWITGMGGDQKYMSLGLQAGVSVAFYLGVGLLVDKWLGTMPIFTLVGALLGVVGMFALFMRMNRELDEKSRQTAAEKEELESE